MKKGFLKKFVDRKFGKGKHDLVANEMVILFCKKYNISGSAHGYNLYTWVQKAWENALKEEAEENEKWNSRY
jgi:hypothetical protein